MLSSLPAEPSTCVAAHPFRFGERPRLAVSYLRSYANFGRVLYWVDEPGPDGHERARIAALERYRRHLRSAMACDAAARACKEEASKAAMKSSAKRSARAARPLGRSSASTTFGEDYGGQSTYECLQKYLYLGRRACVLKLQGFAANHYPPNVLDGHWTTHSSQAYITGVLAESEAEVVQPFGVPLAVYRKNASIPLVSRPGMYNVSFAPLWPDLVNDARARMAEHQKKGQILTVDGPLAAAGSPGCRPHVCHPGARFKLLGLHSC